MNIKPYERDGFMIFIHEPIDLPTDVEFLDRPCDVTIKPISPNKSIPLPDIATLLFRSFYQPKFKLIVAKSQYFCNVSVDNKIYRFKIMYCDSAEGYLKQLADQISI